jgi:hypothetical protein
MKKSLIFILVNFAVFSAFSQGHHHHDSRFFLKMSDNSLFFVKFDGISYDNPTDKFRLNNVTPGWHRIVVFKRFGQYGQTRIVYKGGIDIDRSSKIFAVIDNYNELVIRKIVPTEDMHNPSNTGNSNNYNPVTLNMDQLSHTLNNASFESDKLIIAKQAVSSNGVYSDQVLQILGSFSFESTKLDFAKFAYQYCADRNNYYKINNEFTFKSSIDDLNNFISSQNYNENSYNNNQQQNNYHSTNNDDDEGNGGDW